VKLKSDQRLHVQHPIPSCFNMVPQSNEMLHCGLTMRRLKPLPGIFPIVEAEFVFILIYDLAHIGSIVEVIVEL
jgi:hypothetical protein